MRRAFVSCSRPIRFDEKSVNRGLPVLDQARALEPCHRPEGSWALGTRMPTYLPQDGKIPCPVDRNLEIFLTSHIGFLFIFGQGGDNCI